MPHDARLALKRARRTGVLVCLGTALLAVLFLAGLAHRSYWALAVPVGVGVGAVLALAFWIGLTIATVRGIPPEADAYEGRGARGIALGLCALSIALAAVFVLGVAQRSYWALALPVASAVLGLLGMVGWIGWAIVTQRSTLPAAEAPPGDAAPDGRDAAAPAPPADAAP